VPGTEGLGHYSGRPEEPGGEDHQDPGEQVGDEDGGCQPWPDEAGGCLEQRE